MNAQLFAPPPTIAAPGHDHLRVALTVANARDREAIYRLRHEVYARELCQHAANRARHLRDALDDSNIYLVAHVAGQMAGFISITPPGRVGYSIEKYASRDALPFPFDDQLYEIRLLTVPRAHRGSNLATLLMYAAFRWVEAHGGQRVVAIGRREVVPMYQRCGLDPVGLTIQTGAVTYDFLHATTAALRERMKAFGGLLDRLEGKTDWHLNFPFRKPASCFHGGAFFDAVGPKFDSLERGHTVINADVLDAWFPPSPLGRRRISVPSGRGNRQSRCFGVRKRRELRATKIGPTRQRPSNRNPHRPHPKTERRYRRSPTPRMIPSTSHSVALSQRVARRSPRSAIIESR